MKLNFRNIMVFTMVLVYFALSLRTFIPYIAYKVNYTYVATVLCENRGKPAMHCNGKCHLNKELKKASQNSATDAVDFSKTMLDMHVANHQAIVFFTEDNTIDQHVHYMEKPYFVFGTLTTPPPQV